MSAGVARPSSEPMSRPEQTFGRRRKGDQDGFDPDGPGRRLWTPALDPHPADADPREPGDRGTRRDALAPPDPKAITSGRPRVARPGPGRRTPHVVPGPPHVRRWETPGPASLPGLIA